MANCSVACGGRLQAGVGGAGGREAGEHGAQLLQRRGETLAQSLVALGVGPQLDEQAEAVGLLLQALHPALAAGERALPGDALAVEQLQLLRHLPREVLLHQREQQVLLAAEVRVDGALGEAGVGGDLFERGAGKAGARIDPRGGLQQARARLRLARAAVELAARHQPPALDIYSLVDILIGTLRSLASRSGAMKSQLPPGPRMPAALQTLGFWSSPNAFMERCAARYGRRFTLRVFSQPPFVVLWDPEEIKEVFQAPPDVLHPGEGARILEPLVGRHSVILLDEGPHLEQRKLLLPAFHGERMQRLTGLMGELAEREVASWPRGEPIVLHARLQRLTLEIILRAVFGLEQGRAAG